VSNKIVTTDYVKGHYLKDFDLAVLFLGITVLRYNICNNKLRIGGNMKGKLFTSIMVFLVALLFQSVCLADKFDDSLCQWVPRDINAKVTAINVKAMEITLRRGYWSQLFLQY
jgi:hypothetical protein